MIHDVAASATAATAAAALAVSVAPDRGRGLEGVGSYAPATDLVAPAIGLVALLATAQVIGGPYTLSAARLLAGALLLGLVTKRCSSATGIWSNPGSADSRSASWSASPHSHGRSTSPSCSSRPAWSRC